MTTHTANTREDLIEKLPEELQCYGVSLLWTLVALAQAAPRLEHVILKTLPPGSLDSLSETEALTPKRELTPKGRRLAQLAHEYREIIEEISPSIDLVPLDAVLRVQESLAANPYDVIRQSSEETRVRVAEAIEQA